MQVTSDKLHIETNENINKDRKHTKHLWMKQSFTTNISYVGLEGC